MQQRTIGNELDFAELDRSKVDDVQVGKVGILRRKKESR